MSTRGKDPINQSDRHNERGIELADRGWLDEAINEFRKAIDLDPASAHAHDNLATVYAEKRMYKEALSEYLTAMRLEPENPTAHYNLACFLTQHGPEMAVEEFQESIRLDPEYSDAHLNLGLTLADQGRGDEAQKAIRAAIELAPDDAFARHELAILLMDADDYRQAIVQLREVVKLESQNFDAWVDLGVCYAQKGFFAEAERSYNRACALRPDDALATYNLAALYAQWERTEPALEHLSRALRLDPERVRDWLSADPMFDALKHLPAFHQVVAAETEDSPSADTAVEPPPSDETV